MTPLSLTDDQLSCLISAAAPIPVEARGKFLCDLATAITVTSTADVATLIKRLQRGYLAAVSGCANDRHQGTAA